MKVIAYLFLLAHDSYFSKVILPFLVSMSDPLQKSHHSVIGAIESLICHQLIQLVGVFEDKVNLRDESQRF